MFKEFFQVAHSIEIMSECFQQSLKSPNQCTSAIVSMITGAGGILEGIYKVYLFIWLVGWLFKLIY